MISIERLAPFASILVVTIRFAGAIAMSGVTFIVNRCSPDITLRGIPSSSRTPQIRYRAFITPSLATAFCGGFALIRKRASGVPVRALPGQRRRQSILSDQHGANPGRALVCPIAQGERFSAPIVG